MSPIHAKLPQDPYLVDFIHHSQSLPPDHVIVVDHETGVKATITELITAVCEYRVRLGQELGMDILCSVREGEEVFVATMFPPGYDFLVAFLASRSVLEWFLWQQNCCPKKLPTLSLNLGRGSYCVIRSA
ncbi:hypothetical protein H9Q72_011105 [Fusarium xylarioides]|uniref:Uncharacterized protein n=1 Tax=Fusarium xylarioides TaxID=221167 RepID=A0A9P7HJM2_9HYPO|nr:hypothetical protein H9Q70_010007 [Fusarium xylarioides]KAG5760783.1 hypothetical protein H9Q72_011105 [Fusarium xylarioides]